MTFTFNLIVDILTVVAGVLGVVCISVVGIKYMTAGGNEMKVKKVKHEFYEIMIGILVFSVMTVILRWVQMFIGV